MPSSPRIRLSDVAVVAGVSLSTASKALNGNPRISEATRLRVEEAAARLDFRPNALAQSFASGRSRTVGVLAHHASNTFSRPVLVGAVVALGEQQQAALVLDGDVRAHREMRESIRALTDRRIDGVLVVGDRHELTPSITHNFEVPVTYVYTASDEASDVVYLPDNEAAGRTAVQHLIDTGRSRIAHITADASRLTVRRRERGMHAALSEAGLSLAAPTYYDDWTQSSGAAGMNALLDSGVEIDAVFCGNDHIAFGAMEACAARGIRVPEDIAFVGVDNWEGVILNQDVRRLTTVDLELFTLGETAARSLLAPAQEPGEHFLPVTLVLGPSS